MSEKRFTTSDPTIQYSQIVTIVWDSKECKHLIVDEVVDLLNELYEENKKLEHKANFWHKKYRVVKTTIIRDDDL